MDIVIAVADRTEPDEHGAYGYFIVGRGKLASEPFVAGDDVDVYPILEPFPASQIARFRELEALNARQAPQLPLSLAQLDAASLAVAEGRQELSVALRIFCPYEEKNSSTLVTVGTTETGLAWAIVGRERVPAAFQTEHRADGRKACLIHPRLSSNYQTTRCRHRRTWGIEIANTHVRVIKLGVPKYGARVAP